VLRQRAAEHGMLVAMATYGAPTAGMASPSREFTRGQQHPGRGGQAGAGTRGVRGGDGNRVGDG
jgi:hypothetical protein